MLIALLVGVNASAAQDEIDPELLEQMHTLEQVTENIRNLPATSEIDHRFPTREETIAYLRETYSREFPPEEFARLARFYIALGLLPAGTDLQEVFLRLLGSQVAGYYDPDTETMNVLPTTGDDPGSELSITEQVIYVHEFTHALQDMHFDLDSLLEAPEIADHPDRSLAALSLVEGDASAAMTLYLQEVAARNPMAALSLLVEGLQSGGLFLPEGIPQILVDELMFPYQDGMNFVIALSQDGGWERVNEAYANPPTTTEQILHPEKYVTRETGQDVELVDASAALGDGWLADWDTTLGEFYLRKHLDLHLSSSQAASAASGWGGDRFRVYYNADTGEIAWALRTAWDNNDAYREFIELYAIFATTWFDDAASDASCWENETGALCMMQYDAERDSLIVFAPTLEQALALRDASF
jgi:hypothetical protein